MATLSLTIPQPVVTRNTPFLGSVSITGGIPGSRVSVFLQQVSGAGAWTNRQSGQVDEHGNGFAVFPQIVLVGIDGGFDTAVLLAQADQFSSDAQSVEVV
jgi:hypothetical protein